MLTFHGSPFAPGYAASKGGVGQLTESLAAAWAQEGIRVNAVAPGWIATELTKPLVEDAGALSSHSGHARRRTAGASPSDVGGAILFLLSDRGAVRDRRDPPGRRWLSGGLAPPASARKVAAFRKKPRPETARHARYDNRADDLARKQ